MLTAQVKCQVVSYHLTKSSELKKSANDQLKHRFSSNTIAEKLGCILGIHVYLNWTWLKEEHLPRFSELKNGVNDLLKRGFGVNTIVEKLA